MKIRNLILLVVTAVLIGISLWVLEGGLPSAFPERAMQDAPRLMARQGIAAVLALALVYLMGRFLPARKLTQVWWLPLALFGVLLLAVPLSLWAGLGVVINGTHWWQRSPGLIAAMLAVIGGMSYALPRFNRAERGGLPALAAVVLLAPAVAWLMLGGLAPLFLLFAIIGLTILAGGHGWRRWAILAAVVAFFTAVMLTLYATNPRLIERFLSQYSPTANGNFQILTAMLSIHVGGLTGDKYFPPDLPAWHTDFIFSRLCGKGGILSGMVVLVLTGLMLTLVWRIAARRGDPRSRVMAAGCAAALTAQVFFHLLVNFGWWPVMPMALPFLSFAPLLLLMDGLLLGALIALDREDDSSAPVPARWPTTLIVIAGWVLLVPCAMRLHALVFKSPDLAAMQERRIERIAAWRWENRLPERGRILDVNGTVLVQPGKRLVLCADPSLLADSPDRHLLPVLARMAEMNETTLLDQIANSHRKHVRLLPNVPPNTAEAIRRLNLKGISFMTVPTREYPASAPMAHLMGFVRSGERASDFQGVCGVEMIHDNYLMAGMDARLTLDHGLQLAVQQIAEAAALETQATQVQIIVMNPRTGAIRAAAQVPAAHGSGTNSVSSSGYWWGALIEMHEPGGLIKPLVMASALDSGVLNPETPIFCENGTWLHKGYPLHDAAPFGDLTPARILAHSSNIGMGKIGVMMGKRALYGALGSWNFGQRCSAGLNGASSGRIAPSDTWSNREITRIPIGYASSATLLQLLRAYTVFFNDGLMAEPYLIEPDAPPAPKQILKPATARWMRDTLTQAVDSGTGQNARIEGLPISGKTAIVQKLIPNKREYSSDKIEASFIGGFEHSGTPSLIVVWFDDPQREGQENPAAITFRKIALMMTGGKRQ
jgi:cell division protein FtsI (penicillin-binding protein 3)